MRVYICEDCGNIFEVECREPYCDNCNSENTYDLENAGLQTIEVRNIKFQGKRTYTGEWIIGDLRHLNDGRVSIIPEPEKQKDNNIMGFPVIAESVTILNERGV